MACVTFPGYPLVVPPTASYTSHIMQPGHEYASLPGLKDPAFPGVMVPDTADEHRQRDIINYSMLS